MIFGGRCRKVSLWGVGRGSFHILCRFDAIAGSADAVVAEVDVPDVGERGYLC